MSSSSGYRKRNSLLELFIRFLEMSPNSPSLLSCTPDDVRRFLVWKDMKGKTTVHNIDCPNLGLLGNFECSCPKRLASGTVEVIIQHLVNIFDNHGLGRTWRVGNKIGNPAAAPIVKEYLKLIREEQARAHVIPKQARPIFLSKIKTISAFIDRELGKTDLSLRDRCILYRDQAWLKLQFFAGDRAGDLSVVVSQEVKMLDDDSGFVFQHTFGKTLRGDKGKNNSFVIKRCVDEMFVLLKVY